jgi:hypothetical protein
VHRENSFQRVEVLALQELRPRRAGGSKAVNRVAIPRVAPLNTALVFAARKPPPSLHFALNDNCETHANRHFGAKFIFHSGPVKVKFIGACFTIHGFANWRS